MRTGWRILTIAILQRNRAQVAELVAALDSGSSGRLGREGSSPFLGTPKLPRISPFWPILRLFLFRPLPSGQRNGPLAARLRGKAVPVAHSQETCLKVDGVSFTPQEAALGLACTYLEHGIVLARRMPRTPPVLKQLKRTRQRAYYDALPEGTFTTATALQVAQAQSLHTRTAERYLKKFASLGLLEDVQHGQWHKPGLMM